MKDEGDGSISFISRLEDVAIRDIADWNNDGSFQLQTRDTDKCLDYENGSRVATGCKFGLALKIFCI
ncbi:hypothetical protein BTJ40_05310 [Microbulbifer sp. A4B17]|uniref:hypothetical protein n=1 Tax=Microbulbifer sp. A4B17 TaxID=359370 RepID=UPI000D52D271|nr:hypothetical protein [Microbulbifer sp. A4B17]AWF80274.1 hypothetical protein BTJ40_05310 [Microbulbifer sp. A4B17]